MEKKVVTYEMMHEVLHDVITGLKDDSLKINKAKELNNACGKAITMGMGRLQAAIKQGIALDIPELGIGEMELSSAIGGRTPKGLSR